MFGHQAIDHVQESIQDTEPRRQEMQGPAPARLTIEEEWNREIEDGWRADATGLAPIQTGVHPQDRDAADEEATKGNGVDPVGDPDDG